MSSDRPNSTDTKPAFMLGASSKHRGPWAPSKARHKPDQIATIVQPLIIDRPIAGGIGRAFNEEDWAAGRNLERLSATGSAAAASNLYSASTRGVPYLSSSSAKTGSASRSFSATFSPRSRGK